MVERFQKLDIEGKKSSVLIPSIIVKSQPSFASLRSNFSGPARFEPKEYATLTPSCLEPLTIIIELKDSEVDEILKKPQPLLIEVFKEKKVLFKGGKKAQEKVYQALLEYIESKAREKHLKLSDDVKKALANLMIFIAKKLDEET